MRDSQTLLLRALGRAANPSPAVRIAHSEAWASATFVGARHRFEFEPADPPAADAFAAGIEQVEFALPGHLVADILVSTRTATPAGIALTIEALTVEDR